MKSYLKSEIARAAGVSYSTFHRWTKQQSEQLSQCGVTPRSQLLPPVAVKWICAQYGIDCLALKNVVFDSTFFRARQGRGWMGFSFRKNNRR